MQKIEDRRRRRSQEAESISLGISCSSRHRSKVYIQRNTGLSFAVFALVKPKKGEGKISRIVRMRWPCRTESKTKQ